MEVAIPSDHDLFMEFLVSGPRGQERARSVSGGVGWAEREETQVQKDKWRKRVSVATETNTQKRNLHSDPVRDGWLIAPLQSQGVTLVYSLTLRL